MSWNRSSGLLGGNYTAHHLLERSQFTDLLPQGSNHPRSWKKQIRSWQKRDLICPITTTPSTCRPRTLNTSTNRGVSTSPSTRRYPTLLVWSLIQWRPRPPATRSSRVTSTTPSPWCYGGSARAATPTTIPNQYVPFLLFPIPLPKQTHRICSVCPKTSRGINQILIERKDILALYKLGAA